VAAVIEALAAIGGIGTVGLAAAIVVMAFKLAAASREQLAVRDLLDEEREQHRKTRGELEVETAAHGVTKKQLKAEKQLRASVESERNHAYQQARNDVVERIKKSKVADAQHILADLLALPLPGFVPSGETVPAGDPNRTDDDLIKPDL
jgi:hypothetical protein